MRVGEMVVCVGGEDEWEVVDGLDSNNFPELGEVYQVLGLHLFDDGAGDVLYISIDLVFDDGNACYQAEAFRPVAYGPLPARRAKEPIS